MAESLIVRKGGGGAKINGVEKTFVAGGTIQAGDIVAIDNLSSFYDIDEDLFSPFTVSDSAVVDASSLLHASKKFDIYYEKNKIFYSHARSGSGLGVKVGRVVSYRNTSTNEHIVTLISPSFNMHSGTNYTNNSLRVLLHKDNEYLFYVSHASLISPFSVQQNGYPAPILTHQFLSGSGIFNSADIYTFNFFNSRKYAAYTASNGNVAFMLYTAGSSAPNMFGSGNQITVGSNQGSILDNDLFLNVNSFSATPGTDTDVYVFFHTYSLESTNVVRTALYSNYMNGTINLVSNTTKNLQIQNFTFVNAYKPIGTQNMLYYVGAGGGSNANKPAIITHSSFSTTFSNTPLILETGNAVGFNGAKPEIIRTAMEERKYFEFTEAFKYDRYSFNTYLAFYPVLINGQHKVKLYFLNAPSQNFEKVSEVVLDIPALAIKARMIDTNKVAVLYIDANDRLLKYKEYSLKAKLVKYVNTNDQNFKQLVLGVAKNNASINQEVTVITY